MSQFTLFYPKENEKTFLRFRFRLDRTDPSQSWGFSLTGGWKEGVWLGKEGVCLGKEGVRLGKEGVWLGKEGVW